MFVGLGSQGFTLIKGYGCVGYSRGIRQGLMAVETLEKLPQFNARLAPPRAYSAKGRTPEHRAREAQRAACRSAAGRRSRPPRAAASAESEGPNSPTRAYSAKGRTPEHRAREAQRAACRSAAGRRSRPPRAAASAESEGPNSPIIRRERAAGFGGGASVRTTPPLRCSTTLLASGVRRGGPQASE